MGVVVNLFFIRSYSCCMREYTRGCIWQLENAILDIRWKRLHTGSVDLVPGLYKCCWGLIVTGPIPECSPNLVETFQKPLF